MLQPLKYSDQKELIYKIAINQMLQSMSSDTETNSDHKNFTGRTGKYNTIQLVRLPLILAFIYLMIN